MIIIDKHMSTSKTELSMTTYFGDPWTIRTQGHKHEEIEEYDCFINTRGERTSTSEDEGC